MNDGGQSSAKRGGEIRAKKLTAEERQEIARQAANARWEKITPLPKAVLSGGLEIAEREISCAVLEDGTRVLTQETFLTAIGRAAKAKAGTGSERIADGVDGLPPFLTAANLQGYISDELRAAATPIVFRNIRGNKAYGYRADLLPRVCEVYLAAKDDDKLLVSQEKVAQAAYLLMRGLAHVGIIALVDEATGYQDQRAKDELRKILAAYISEELLPWTERFPREFFRQIYRLQGWEFNPSTTKRTPFVGKLINRYVYEQLPPGVLNELREKNPVIPEKGYRRYKLHQFLTPDTGHVHLDRQITKVITLMQLANNKEDFESMFRRVGISEALANPTIEVEVDKNKKVKLRRKPNPEMMDQLNLFEQAAQQDKRDGAK